MYVHCLGIRWIDLFLVQQPLVPYEQSFHRDVPRWHSLPSLADSHSLIFASSWPQPAVRRHKYLGTICPHVGIQFSIAFTHLLEIVSGIRTICQYPHYVNDGEIPFLLIAVPDGANLALLKQLYGFLLTHLLLSVSCGSEARPPRAYIVFFFCLEVLSRHTEITELFSF